jgi:hypothetical protein
MWDSVGQPRSSSPADLPEGRYRFNDIIVTSAV